jgi:S-DNA-T family DNA segregation ATPase FtsK/SpoIIIE
MLFVGGPICIVLFLVSAGFSAHAEKMPSSADLQGIPPTDESPIRKQVKVENEHAKYESDYLDYLPGAKDPLFGEALAQIIVDERAAIVRLQRELRIGYGRAAAIIEAMRSEGFIGDLDLATRSYPVLPKAYEGLKHLGFADEAPADEKR